MRIGILGGTFNPIHIGHLILAEEALSKLRLDKVVFVPAYIPPHKHVEGSVKPKDRLKMVELAIADNGSFEVSTFELEAKKKSYSIDTLKEFREKYGEGAQLFFITGSDLLKDLFSWKNVNEIFKMSKFIVANRPLRPRWVWRATSSSLPSRERNSCLTSWCSSGDPARSIAS